MTELRREDSMTKHDIGLLGPVLVAVAIVSGSAGPSAAESCQELVNNFNQAVDTGHGAAAQALIDRIAEDATCGAYQIPAQRRLAAFRLSAAQQQMAAGRPAEEYEQLVVEADKPQVLWQAAATLGDTRFGQRRFVDAAEAFDRAIEIIRNETLTPKAPSQYDIENLLQRAGQARLLAAHVAEDNAKKGFVKTARDERDGMLGGIYAPSVRGIVPVAIPIPITFEFAQTKFTPVGGAAAHELLSAIKEQHPSEITLIGHTDARGGAEFNMKLSEDRAAAVADYLRSNGVEAKINTIGKGASDPMHLTDTAGLTQDDIYALNRRVEWRRK
jgi:outer membrane protein OmpA-like peptidoglycan-associated protein